MRAADKDVARTDRDNAYFAGEDNPHLVLLRDILLTHTEHDQELGLASACAGCGLMCARLRARHERLACPHSHGDGHGG